jgi:hypothetical protein
VRSWGLEAASASLLPTLAANGGNWAQSGQGLDDSLIAKLSCIQPRLSAAATAPNSAVCVG